MVIHGGRATNIHKGEKLNWILILDVCEVRHIRALRHRLDKTFIIGSPHASRVAPLCESKHSGKNNTAPGCRMIIQRFAAQLHVWRKHWQLVQLILTKSFKQLMKLIAVNCSGAWAYAAEAVQVITICRKSDSHLTTVTRICFGYWNTKFGSHLTLCNGVCLRC